MSFQIDDYKNSSTVRRAFIFLEDGEWENAKSYFDKELDSNPENAIAYVGLLMAELHVRTMDDLNNQPASFAANKNYQRAVRYADQNLFDELKSSVKNIVDRKDEAVYQPAKKKMLNASSEEEYSKAADEFKSISGYKDADVLSSQCLAAGEKAVTNGIYMSAKEDMALGTEDGYQSAANKFRGISEYLDSPELAVFCEEKIKGIQETGRIEKEKRSASIKKTVISLSAVVILVTAAILLTTKVIIPNSKYNAAVTLMNNGQYEEAITAFEAMNGYKDSTEKIAETKPHYHKALLESADVGSNVLLGTYEQDSNAENGKEDVEWTVLAKEGDKLLLISKYALEARSYNTEYTSVTWENCTLRTWLNTAFYTTAFNAEEQKLIVETTVIADKNPEYGTDPGNSTKDKVFLLSISEANKYFANDEARKCVPTAYAKAQGAYTNDYYKTAGGEAACVWWLRSPGYDSDDAAGVDNDGSVGEGGANVSYDDPCVRPALWIDLAP